MPNDEQDLLTAREERKVTAQAIGCVLLVLFGAALIGGLVGYAIGELR